MFQAGVLFATAGVVCLFLLAYLRWLPSVLVVFVIRGAFANAIYPIDRLSVHSFFCSKTGAGGADDPVVSGIAVFGTRIDLTRTRPEPGHIGQELEPTSSR